MKQRTIQGTVSVSRLQTTQRQTTGRQSTLQAFFQLIQTSQMLVQRTNKTMRSITSLPQLQIMNIRQLQSKIHRVSRIALRLNRIAAGYPPRRRQRYVKRLATIQSSKRRLGFRGQRTLLLGCYSYQSNTILDALSLTRQRRHSCANLEVGLVLTLLVRYTERTYRRTVSTAS